MFRCLEYVIFEEREGIEIISIFVKHLQEILLQTWAGYCGLQSRQREARLRPERGPGQAEPETIV